MSLTQELVTISNRFGFNLLAQLATRRPNKNIFISPASLLQALAMVYNGAEGHTAVSVAKTLQLPNISQDVINAAGAELWQNIAALDAKTTLLNANALWAAPNFDFNPKFWEIVHSYYQAHIANVNFNDVNQAAGTINGWVKEQTQGQIADLVPPDALQQAALVLTNAIYFKGMWTHPFDPQKTKPGKFTLINGRAQELPMMTHSGSYHYNETSDFQMVSLPFGSSRMSMIILLPLKGMPLSRLQISLSRRAWAKWMSRLIRVPNYLIQSGKWAPEIVQRGCVPGQISLPRFRMAYEVELKPVLRSMGLEGVYTRISAASESFILSHVLHKTQLEVNEEGAEAAAATAAVMVRGMVKRPSQMNVNRPFFCAIQDNLTGLILFMGTIFEPES